MPANEEQESAFARGGVRVEKLTIAPPVSVRFTVGGLEKLQKQADYRGMERSDYIRHLVLQDELELKKQFNALSPLFSDSDNGSMNTAADSVGRES